MNDCEFPGHCEKTFKALRERLAAAEKRAKVAESRLGIARKSLSAIRDNEYGAAHCEASYALDAIAAVKP